MDRRSTPPRNRARYFSQSASGLHHRHVKKYTLKCFERLDALYKPGLSEHEFLLMFIKCAYCELIMTRPAYFAHECYEVVEGHEETEPEEDEEV